MSRRRLAVAAGLALTASVGVVWLGLALADEPLLGTPAPAAHPVTQAVSAGRHERIDGPRGPIHVWVPASYHADTGATVVYVHGYYDTADSAWTAHALPEQFALSALNALFIVPEAPSGVRLPVNYPDLGELLRVVEDKLGVPRGQALTVALGHSGGYRTLEKWLDEPMLDQLVMIDAQYGDEDVIVRWARASDHHRLIMVGQDTVLGTEAVAEKLPEAVTLDRFPPAYELWPAEAKTARIVYVRAQFGHMALVNAGTVIPSVLRLLPVERLADLPWHLPLGSLPALADAGADGRTD